MIRATLVTLAAFVALLVFCEELVRPTTPNTLAVPNAGKWQVQQAKTEADLRGLSVSSKIAWASGTKGTFVRTADGGKT